MSGDGHMKYYYIYNVNWEQVLVQIVLQKLTIGIWASIAKEPLMESEKSNQIMKLLMFFYNSVKTPSDLAK